MIPSFQRFSIFLLIFSQISLILSASASLNDQDKQRLRRVVELKSPLSANTLPNIYYNVNLNYLLDKKVPTNSADICKHIQTSVSSDTIENIYYQVLLSKLLNNCPIDSAKLLKTLPTLIKDNSNVQELYQYGIAMNALGKPLDTASKIPKLLLDALKREDTLLNIGLAFQLASKFAQKQDQNQFVEKIPDVIVQADEINGKFLQFEGGLGVTSAVVSGIYKLTTAANKSTISITNEQALKFVNYFLSRKYVLTPKGANEVIELLSLFTTNNYHIPYMITKYGQSTLSSMENPILTLKITNVLDETVSPGSVVATSLARTNDLNNNLLSKNIQFKPVTGDSKLFAYDFFTDQQLSSKLSAGFYKLKLNVSPSKPDKRILGNEAIEIDMSILTMVKIDNAELTITDSDVGQKNFPLIYPSKLEQMIDVDYLQRIQLKYQIKDTMKTDQTMNVHQSMLRFYHLNTKQEIIFIAELDSNGLFYKIDLNLPTRSKDFMELSGEYQLDLLIGDSLILNPFKWNIGTINIQFSSSSSSSQQQQQSLSSLQRQEYSSKPEIKHLFREQDKRPHAFVSNLFTMLAMVPLLGLFVAWFKIGVNLSNFQFTLSALLFHSSLAAIFLLYGCFFLALNMFQTIKYLAGLSLIIYLSGHSLLSNLIRNKNK